MERREEGEEAVVQGRRRRRRGGKERKGAGLEGSGGTGCSRTRGVGG